MATIDYKVYLRDDDPQLLFEIIEEIGQGSFGFVYKVSHLTSLTSSSFPIFLWWWLNDQRTNWLAVMIK
jgi:hypothetical protein